MNRQGSIGFSTGDAALAVLYVLLLIVALVLRQQALSIDATGAMLGVYALGFVSVFPAVASAGLLYAVRHLYNLHYVAFLGLASWIWFLPLIQSLGESGELAPIIPLVTIAVLFALPWSVSHLMAACGANRREALCWGIAGAFLGLAAIRPEGVFFLFATVIGGPALLLWLLPSIPEPVDKPEHPAWGVISFLLLNLIAVAGLFPLFLLYYYVLIELEGDYVVKTLGDAMLALRDGYIPAESFPFVVLIERYLLGGVALMAGLAAPFIWPVMRISRVQIATALGCLLAGAATAGQPTGTLPFVSLMALVAGLIAASSCAAFEPRAQRWSYAALLAAIGATLGMQCVGAVLRAPVTGMGAWLVEAFALAGVWCAAYFFGIRVIRSRAEATRSTPPPEAIPATTAPAPIENLGHGI